MKQVRNLKSTLTKRVRPALLAVILLFTMGFGSYVPKADASTTLPSYSTHESDGYVDIKETVVPLDDNQRTFRVTLEVTNIANVDSSHNELQNIMITEPVNSNFTISNASKNVNISDNTVSLKQAQSLSESGKITITYDITAKDGVDGQILLNPDNTKTNVSYKYWYEDREWVWDFLFIGHWEYEWNQYNANKSFASPTIYVKPTLEQGEIKFTKTADPVEGQDDKYKITFNISGMLKESDPKKADIVLLIDNSGSMQDSISTIKTAADKLCKDLLTKNAETGENLNKNNNIRISIQSFGSNAKERCDFSSNYSTVSNAISGISANGGGTNTQAGIAEVRSKIADSKSRNSDAQRFAILFTDGLPTYGDGSGDGGYPSQQKFFGDAQYQYDAIVGGISLDHLGKMINSSGQWIDLGDTSRNSYKYKTPSSLPTVTDSKATFYSIGLYPTDGNSGHNLTTKKQWMEGFLYSIQNAETDRKKFVENYCKNDATQVTGVFNDISSSIRQKMSTIIEDATLTDTLSTDFSFPSGLSVNNPTGVTVSVNGVDKTSEVNEAAVSNGKTLIQSVNGREIKFDLTNVPQIADKDNKVNISISFLVDAVDPYLSGAKLETNEGKAVLNYTDSLSNLKDQKQYADPATVTVKPVEGKIVVEKAVVDKNGNSVGNKDKFSVYLQRSIGSDGYHDNAWTDINNNTKQRYGFELPTNQSKEINFYLRGNSTRVDAATDINKNYITAGNYTINEVVPMDYTNTKIQWSYSPIADWGKAGVIVNETKNFMINKTNRKVYIKVTNELTNNSYWRDRSDVSNTFKYTGK